MLTVNQKKYIAKNLSQGVRNLSLANDGITDDDMEDIVNTINTQQIHLNELDLDCNNIGDKGLIELLNLKLADRINLDRNNITYDGLQAFLEKTKYLHDGTCSIKEINLSRNALTLSKPNEEESIKKLTGASLITLISNYTGPVKIEITYNADLTSEEIQRIKDIQQGKQKSQMKLKYT